MDRYVKLPITILNEVLQYLQDQPFKEVASLINNINNNYTVVIPEKETKEEDKKE